MFGHERFEAYQISIEFLRVALCLADNIPTGYSMVKDQLKRAALSIPLNIAEGSGKSSIAEKKRFYAIARGSAMECAAICDVLEIIEHNCSTRTTEAKRLLRSVISILATICSK
jgi:four helix bundle protein